VATLSRPTLAELAAAAAATSAAGTMAPMTGPDVVHVAVATDGAHDDGLPALMVSVARNTQARVFAHIILAGSPTSVG
jgi:hypothetical protein